jgi:hypothetical protein
MECVAFFNQDIDIERNYFSKTRNFSPSAPAFGNAGNGPQEAKRTKGAALSCFAKATQDHASTADGSTPSAVARQTKRVGGVDNSYVQN